MRKLFPFIFVALITGCTSNDLTQEQGATVKLVLPEKNQIGVVGHDNEIYIDGVIDSTIIEKIDSLVSNNKLETAKIIFKSPGGDLTAAMEIGYYIREKGFSTDVGIISGKNGESFAGECYSACPIAFAGGHFRYFDENSKMGVHRFKSDEELKGGIAEADTQEYSGFIVSYLNEMGIDTSLYEEMVAADNSHMENLDILQMISLNLVNNGRLPATWTTYADAQGIRLTGLQETDENQGEIEISCGNPISIKLTLQIIPEINANESSFIVDEEHFALSKDSLNIVKDGYIADFTINPQLAMKVISSDYIGLNVQEDESLAYEFKIDTSLDRKTLGDFFAFCNRKNQS